MNLFESVFRESINSHDSQTVVKENNAVDAEELRKNIDMNIEGMIETLTRLQRLDNIPLDVIKSIDNITEQMMDLSSSLEDHVNVLDTYH